MSTTADHHVVSLEQGSISPCPAYITFIHRAFSLLAEASLHSAEDDVVIIGDSLRLLGTVNHSRAMGGALMTTRIGTTIAVLLVLAGAAGCAATRSEIKLGMPAEKPSVTGVSSGRAAVIRSVIDERVFEQAPQDPSTPSLGFEGAAGASAETKARAVGRKRGGFGMALGDVLLESGQTVEGVIRENLAAALEEAGYKVQAEKEGGPSALVIDVHIKKFWAWFQPGFWALTLSADIATDLNLSGAAEPVSVSVHAEDRMQIATDGDWLKIIGNALERYRAQVIAKAATFPKDATPPGHQGP